MIKFLSGIIVGFIINCLWKKYEEIINFKETTALGLDDNGNDGPNTPWIMPMRLNEDKEGQEWNYDISENNPDALAYHNGREIMFDEPSVHQMTNRELAEWLKENEDNPEATEFINELSRTI